MVEAIRRQIVDHGSVRRGTFGVTLQDLTPDLTRALDLAPENEGVIVSGVKAGSAAARSGLRAGDLIVKLNNEKIANAADIKTQLALMRVGDRLTLGIIRDGRKKNVRARIADPFEDFVDGKKVSRQFRGALLGEVVDESSLGTNQGIAVGPVREDSNAWQSGLREGDVLFQVNRSRVKNLKQLREAAEDTVYRIKLRRGNRLVTLVSR
jgi:S1-C subfamily serine protease